MNNHLQPIQRILNSTIVWSLFLCLFASSGFSQNTISTDLFVMTDSSYLGGSGIATIRIKNVGATTYNGYINIYYTTDTVSFSPLVLCSLQNISLPPLDTISTTCTINFDSSYFDPGNNIVVVWSSGNGKFAADTLKDSVYLAQTAGMHEFLPNASFSISPSPAKEFIQIKIKRPETLNGRLQYAKITDIFGRSVFVQMLPGEGSKISIGHLSPGVYFLELQYENRKRAIQKFVRMD